jgi:prepilin peptidase CpaA
MAAVLLVYIALSILADVKCDKIPNALTAAAMAAGVIIRLVRAGPSCLPLIIADIVIAFLATFILFVIKALRGGDCKMLCAISAMIGMKDCGYVFLLSLIPATFIGIGMMIFTKKKLFSKTMIHYSIPIAIGVCIYLVLNCSDMFLFF